MLLGVVIIGAALGIWGPVGALAAAGLLYVGLRAGRAWGVRQLGAFEAAERLRRMKSRQGGWGIF